MSTQLETLLDAVNTGLGVIKKVADLGGPIIPYATTLSSAISVLQELYKAGHDILPEVLAIKDTFGGTTPTPQDLADLDARIAVARAKLHAPLPPPEDGEPD